ncbi:MAG: hypothetical protein ACRESN_09545, partial [Pseudomonas sp.]
VRSNPNQQCGDKRESYDNNEQIASIKKLGGARHILLGDRLMFAENATHRKTRGVLPDYRLRV